MSDVENGPLTEANRECRDVLCCLLFIAGIVVMIALSSIAYNEGDPDKIYRGVDQNGKECGNTNDPPYG